MTEPRLPSAPRPQGAAAAEDLVDAATGLDGRAWVTVRDLVLRPWDMMRRAAFEHDPRYVGAIKLSLALSTLAIVLMSWLFPPDGMLTSLEQTDPSAWAALQDQLREHGICFAHFADRYSSRYELLNTTATLLECGVLALVLYRFDRARPLLSHLSFALYAYSLWLLVSIPLELALAGLTALGAASWLGTVVAVVLVLVLPGLLVAGVWRLYPAAWPRQLGRAVILLVATAGLFAVAILVIGVGAMAWTRASFGM